MALCFFRLFAPSLLTLLNEGRIYFSFENSKPFSVIQDRLILGLSGGRFYKSVIYGRLQVTPIATGGVRIIFAGLPYHPALFSVLASTARYMQAWIIS